MFGLVADKVCDLLYDLFVDHHVMKVGVRTHPGPHLCLRQKFPLCNPVLKNGQKHGLVLVTQTVDRSGF